MLRSKGFITLLERNSSFKRMPTASQNQVQRWILGNEEEQVQNQVHQAGLKMEMDWLRRNWGHKVSVSITSQKLLYIQAHNIRNLNTLALSMSMLAIIILDLQASTTTRDKQTSNTKEVIITNTSITTPIRHMLPCTSTTYHQTFSYQYTTQKPTNKTILMAMGTISTTINIITMSILRIQT